MTEENGDSDACRAVDGRDGDPEDAHTHGERHPREGAADDAPLRLAVPEMDCPSCAGTVESSVRTLDGVGDVDPSPTTGTVDVAYDPDRTDADAIRARVEAAGYAVDDEETAAFDVPAMDCPSCAGKVENALSTVAGVRDAETEPTTGRVLVSYDPGVASRGDLTVAIEGAGYEVVDDERETESVWRSSRALKTYAGAVFLLGGVLFEFLPVAPHLGTVAGRAVTVDWLLYLAAAGIAGQIVFRNGYYSLRNRSLDIDLLMSVGIVGAVGANLPFEAATLAVLFSVAELLERFSMDRARHSLRELMELSPDTATVLRGGEEVTVPADAVDAGDVVVVRPGQKVPVDGVVVEGESAVDESPITGESVPADKSAGAEVYAGSILADGYLEVEVTATAEESTISQVVEMVEDAQRNRTEHERFVDRFARYYTPIIVAGALATAAVPPLLLGAPFQEWFTRGLTLLVVACPCAFVISTPVSVVSAVTAAAKNGVLVKGGDRLEAVDDVSAVAFDKTGTLTTGELGVTDVIPLDGTDEGELLGCAAALETRSDHPIADAVVDHAASRDVPAREVSNFEALAGRGVRADLDGVTHYAGKPGLFAELGFDLEHVHVETDGGRLVRDCEHGSYLDLVGDVVPRLQSEGKTVVLVGTEERFEGVVAVADTVRPEAKASIARLERLDVERIVMLTGDNERTARAIGSDVGVDEVRADLLPDEKVAAVEELRETYGGVAMVGDGVNDAPALATATVGVAMGAAGTDTALETADVALMGDDLTRVPYLFALSARTGRAIRQNVWSSLAVKVALAVAAPFGLVTVIHAIVVGDMGMSLAVTGNAMRLARVSPGLDGTASSEQPPSRE